MVFTYSSKLTSISLPSNVTCIGDVAFAFCSSLTSITIPAKVESIGRYAFYGDSSLVSATFKEITGWEYLYNSSYSDGIYTISSYSLDAASIAAKNLTNGYSGYYWRRVAK